MKKVIKISSIMIGFGVLLVIALFINPQDIYYSYKAEEVVHRPVKTLLERTEEIGAETKVEYLGRNVYSVNIKDNQYLIQRIEDSDSNYSYKFFYEPNYLIEQGSSLVD